MSTRQRVWGTERDVAVPADVRPFVRSWARIAVVLIAVAAAAGGCTKAQLDGDSAAYLQIASLEGASVQAASSTTPTFSNVLNSDVCVHVGGSCSIFDDAGQVTLQLALKDPGSSSTPNTPTTTNFVTVNRYHVDYIRADGHNVQGVDVPYSFDSAITVTVGTINATATLTLVRIQAKEEAPLAALASPGSTVAISTIAEVTFYGTDQAGRAVSVMGQIEVNFADWADPPSTSSGGSGSSS